MRRSELVVEPAAEWKPRIETDHPENDSDQDWPTALSLLEAAEMALSIALKEIDDYGISFDEDAQVNRVKNDIRDFLFNLDTEAAALEEEKKGQKIALAVVERELQKSRPEGKMVVMGPVARVDEVRVGTVLSLACSHQHCHNCDLIRCGCSCHDDELI